MPDNYNFPNGFNGDNNNKQDNTRIDGEYSFQRPQHRFYTNPPKSADDVFTKPYEKPGVGDSDYNSVSWKSNADGHSQSKVFIKNPYAEVTPNTPQHNENNPDLSSKPNAKKEKKGISKAFVAIMLIVCVVLSSAIGFGGAVLYLNASNNNKDKSGKNDTFVINTVDVDEQTSSQLVDKPTSQISEEVSDTVVEITTEIMSTSMFYDQYVSQGAGSGVIVSTDGYIVTNNHVIEGATSITVTLKNKETYEAELVGTDSVIDIALLKIDATGLKAATFGDSDELKVGDKAVAIGNPLGQLGGTVTDGIISALDRDVVIGDETMHLLQTDTAINPGNSGGGLFDGQGRLVGIVVAKSAGSEIEGLGFAIPINDVVDVINDLKEHGYVRGRVAVGVELMDITNPMYSKYYYNTDSVGCFVNGVLQGSSAEKAGIAVGDRIVSVDGKKIEGAEDVELAIDGKEVGDVVKFEIERNGKYLDLKVTLQEYIPAN